MKTWVPVSVAAALCLAAPPRVITADAPAAAAPQGKIVCERVGTLRIIDVPSAKVEDIDLPEIMEHPAWDHEGRRIAYSSTFGVSILDTMAHSFWVVSPAGQDASGPVWSPDGRRLLYESRGAEPGLYVQEMHDIKDAHDIKRVRIPLSMAASEPDWHPTADRILFVGTVGDAKHVFSLDLACLKDASCAASAQQLTKDGKANLAPAWSPDGTRIAFERREGDKASAIMVMKADGSDAKRVSAAKGANDRHPTWGPDGSIACEREWTGPHPAIVVFHSDGGAKELIKDGGKNPRWWLGH